MQTLTSILEVSIGINLAYSMIKNVREYGLERIKSKVTKYGVDSKLLSDLLNDPDDTHFEYRDNLSHVDSCRDQCEIKVNRLGRKFSSITTILAVISVLFLIAIAFVVDYPLGYVYKSSIVILLLLPMPLFILYMWYSCREEEKKIDALRESLKSRIESVKKRVETTVTKLEKKISM